VEKIIPPVDPSQPEKAQIGIEGADDLYREIRVENTLEDEKGKQVALKPGVQVDVTIAALGFFYLSNRHTLSTIFARDLSAPKSIAARGAHIVDVVLNYLKR